MFSHLKHVLFFLYMDMRHIFKHGLLTAVYTVRQIYVFKVYILAIFSHNYLFDTLRAIFKSPILRKFLYT